MALSIHLQYSAATVPSRVSRPQDHSIEAKQRWSGTAMPSRKYERRADLGLQHHSSAVRAVTRERHNVRKALTSHGLRHYGVQLLALEGCGLIQGLFRVARTPGRSHEPRICDSQTAEIDQKQERTFQACD
jgi:hypothetical protein